MCLYARDADERLRWKGGCHRRYLTRGLVLSFFQLEVYGMKKWRGSHTDVSVCDYEWDLFSGH